MSKIRITTRLYVGTLFILGILSLSVFSQGQTTRNKTIASCNSGRATAGTIGVALGAPPSAMICKAHW